MVEHIKYLGHDTFKIRDVKNNLIIYIDPFKITSMSESADIILITHEHYDHCSPPDVKKILKPETIIVCPRDCQGKITGHIEQISPGMTVVVKGVKITAVPAYNTNKKYHPKSNNWVGYIITVNGQTIYHAGDTDIIPEMAQLGKIDIALVPVSGTYVMTAEEAAKAVNEKIKPKIAIPMHYSVIVGSKQDAEEFRKLAQCKVEILL